MNEALTKYHLSKEQIDQEMILVLEAKKDASRFSVLYERYYPQIFLFVLKRVTSEEIAADITSQVFLKALLNLGKYRNLGLPFSSWLFRIARNAIYDLYQQSKIEMVVSLEKKSIKGMISEMGVEEKEEFSELHIALESLGDEDMELIELRFFESRPFKEVAEILDITENNAKVRTYRVLDKLKNLMKK